jgi:hypothetical protein
MEAPAAIADSHGGGDLSASAVGAEALGAVAAPDFGGFVGGFCGIWGFCCGFGGTDEW